MVRMQVKHALDYPLGVPGSPKASILVGQIRTYFDRHRIERIGFLLVAKHVQVSVLLVCGVCPPHVGKRVTRTKADSSVQSVFGLCVAITAQIVIGLHADCLGKLRCKLQCCLQVMLYLSVDFINDLAVTAVPVLLEQQFCVCCANVSRRVSRIDRQCSRK